MRELRTSGPQRLVEQGEDLEFVLPIDTRGLAAGIYEVWIDMLMDDRNWMALHGAMPFTTLLRIETFSHAIAVDADAVPIAAGGSAVIRGTLRNTCGKPWPGGIGDGPLQVGARLFRQSADAQAVREFRAFVDRLPETLQDEVPFRLVLDSAELERGTYALSIDVVKEHEFWMEEKGATPTVIPVVIG
jgi:hypothetical protein